MVTIFIVTMFFSCESDIKKVQQLNETNFLPTGEADTINLKYTDSGQIKSILKSPKMLDYSSILNPFTEFPKGVKVILYDEKGKKTFVTSKYAVTFKNTDLIYLQGKVKIYNESGQEKEVKL